MNPSVKAAIRALAHEEWTTGRGLLEDELRSHPAWADGWALLSGAHLAVADVDAARAASARALELAPGRFLPNMKAGELAMRLGDLEAAEVRLLAAVRSTDPDTADAAAASRALLIVRRATRSGISHRASLPGRPDLSRLASSLTVRLRRVRPVGEAT
jgi:hypothetical protein